MNEELKLKNRLEVARTEKNLSQDQLAVLAGVSLQTISSIEAGQYCPSAKLAQILSIKLEKKFEELFYFEEVNIQSDKVTTTKDERAIFFENVSYRFGYTLIALILLLVSFCRILILDDIAWDLYGIVLLSCLVMELYKFKKKIFDKKWIAEIYIFLLVALSIALISYFIERAL